MKQQWLVTLTLVAAVSGQYACTATGTPIPLDFAAGGASPDGSAGAEAGPASGGAVGATDAPAVADPDTTDPGPTGAAGSATASDVPGGAVGGAPGTETGGTTGTETGDTTSITSAGTTGTTTGGTGGTITATSCTPTVAVALPITVSDSFAPTGWMGDTTQVTMPLDSCPARAPGAIGDCYTVDYNFEAGGVGWAAVQWQHPNDNWGDSPGLCVAEGATSINFCARGEVGGEIVSFGGAGVSGPADVMLTTEWKAYSVTLTGASYNTATTVGGVSNGFEWAAAGIAPIRFYIDDVRWESSGPSGTCPL